MNSNSLENVINHSVLPQIHLLQQQYSELSDTMLKLTVLLYQSDNKEERIINLLQEHSKPVDENQTTKKDEDLKLEKSYSQLLYNQLLKPDDKTTSIKELEVSLVNMIALKKNFQSYYLNDFKTAHQLNQIQMSNFTSQQALSSESKLQMSRIQNIQNQMDEFQKNVEEAKRNQDMEAAYRLNYTEQFLKSSQQQNELKQRFTQLEQDLFKQTLNIKDKIGYKDVPILTDVFRQDFVHKLIFEQTLSRLSEDLNLGLLGKLSKDDFSDLYQQVQVLERDLYKKIYQDLDQKIEKQLNESLSRYALRERFEEQIVIVDYNFKKVNQELQNQEKNVKLYYKEQASPLEKKQKEESSQTKQTLLQLEDRIKTLEIREQKKPDNSQEQLLIQQVFKQLQQRLPDNTEELSQVKKQVEDVFVRADQTEQKQNEFKKITQRYFDVHQETLQEKLGKNEFTEFKKDVESQYFTQIKGVDIFHRLMVMEKQTRETSFTLDAMTNNIVQLMEKCKNLSQSIIKVKTNNPLDGEEGYGCIQNIKNILYKREVESMNEWRNSNRIYFKNYQRTIFYVKLIDNNCNNNRNLIERMRALNVIVSLITIKLYRINLFDVWNTFKFITKHY